MFLTLLLLPARLFCPPCALPLPSRPLSNNPSCLGLFDWTVTFASTGLDCVRDCQDDEQEEQHEYEDSGDEWGNSHGDDNDNEGGVNDDLVGAAFGAKERTKHGDYSAFEHPLERRANEAKQNDCKVM